MRSVRVSVLVIGLFLAWTLAAPAGASDTRFGLELTAVDFSVSDNESATFGWWNPGKYDAWQSDPDEGFDLTGARMLFVTGDYTVIVGAEHHPTLSGTAQVDDGLGGFDELDVRMEIEAYDLALSQAFGEPGRAVFAPWVGVAHFRIKERRTDAGASPAETAMSRLWGVTLGLDWGVTVAGDFALTGRAFGRWATGNREAEQLVANADVGLPDDTLVDITDSVERAMWGADLGVRWRAHDAFQVEAGWSTRDWTFDDGPAEFSGPFVRMVAGF